MCTEIRRAVLFISACLFFFASSVFATGTSSSIVFTPHWLPQAQFAGFYVALDKGFYEEEGLEVTIIHPTSSEDPLAFLRSGKADIVSHFLVSALIARSEGVDLVNVGQLSQHSAMLFVSHKSSGVEHLEDFEGKSVGAWLAGFSEVARSMLDRQNIQVEWYPILGTVNMFLAGGIDIMTVMWYNEYHQLYLSGINLDELHAFFLSDYGYNIPEDGLYTLANTLELRRDDIEKFVQATLRGWDYAAANKEYTLELVVALMREQNLPGNRAHQRWMLDRIFELHEFDSKGVNRTELCPHDYNTIIEILQERQMMADACEYSVFHHPVWLDAAK